MPCWDEPATAELAAVGRAAGLHAVGTCSARPWTWARGVIERGRAEGRDGGMAFTYRNPARSADPARLLPGARSLAVGALGYPAELPGRPCGSPARVARYAAADHTGRLRAALHRMAVHLRDRGARAVVVADENGLVDREAAWRAGIGWIGKSSLLLVPGAGSWFVLGAVVTDADLASLRPPQPDGCGSCRRCVDGCPTGAIVGPGVVDARRCLSWLLQRPGTFPEEHRAALGDRLYGCDDCQEVCPPNRRAPDRSEARGTWLDAAALLALDDAALLEVADRWYVPGRDPAVLRRNLLLVLGNAGDPADAEVHRLLAESAAHADPVLAEHARWALARLEVRSASGGGEDGPA